MKLLPLLLLIVFASCNPYKQLGTHPPKTTKDSLRLAAKCQQAFPTVPSVIIQEYIDTVYLEEIGSSDNVQTPDTDNESEYTEDLGQDVPLVAQPEKVKPKPKPKPGTPMVITRTRIVTTTLIDSVGIFRERIVKEAALKEVVRLNKKYEKYSMYKFGFFAYPIMLLLALLLYFWARIGFKIPKFNFIGR